jgi:hypothetical protein
MKRKTRDGPLWLLVWMLAGAFGFGLMLCELSR